MVHIINTLSHFINCPIQTSLPITTLYIHIIILCSISNYSLFAKCYYVIPHKLHKLGGMYSTMPIIVYVIIV